MIIVNKSDILAKLLGNLGENAQPAFSCLVIDLVIAFVKDLREEAF
jgi:hypothetical protein